MKKVLSAIGTVIVVIIILFLSLPALREQFIYQAPPTIKYTKARDYIGEEVVIEDKIKSSNVDDDGNVYMVIGSSDKTGVVVFFPAANDDLKIPSDDAKIRVKGTITEDDSVKPSILGIEVKSNEQVEELKKWYCRTKKNTQEMTLNWLCYINL